MSRLKPADLPRLSDRYPCIYLERSRIDRRGNAILLLDHEGEALLPVTELAFIMLGPGCTVTHAAVSLMSECGASLLWVGEGGVRFYAGGAALTASNRLALRQAELSITPKGRLAAARVLYGKRFPDEDLSGATMKQLLGMEGRRMAAVYKEQAELHGVEWSGRRSRGCDPVNTALTEANQCLYGLAWAVVSALGLSPALGFIHNGNQRSLLFDLADLYKAEISIPLAFSLAKTPLPQVRDRARRHMVAAMDRARLLGRCVADMLDVLDATPDWLDGDGCRLNTGGGSTIASGGNLGDRW